MSKYVWALVAGNMDCYEDENETNPAGFWLGNCETNQTFILPGDFETVRALINAAIPATQAGDPGGAAGTARAPTDARHGNDYCAECDCIAGNGQRGHHMAYAGFDTETRVSTCAFCPHSRPPVNAAAAGTGTPDVTLGHATPCKCGSATLEGRCVNDCGGGTLAPGEAPTWPTLQSEAWLFDVIDRLTTAVGNGARGGDGLTGKDCGDYLHEAAGLMAEYAALAKVAQDSVIKGPGAFVSAYPPIREPGLREAETKACRQCSECEGKHHWIEDAAFSCKHCPEMVPGCEGCDQPATRRTDDDVDLCEDCANEAGAVSTPGEETTK